MRALRTALFIVLWVLGPATAAFGAQAAPAFVDSEPDQGELFHEAPSEVRIEFSEPLGTESSAQVYDECGRRVDDGQVTIEGVTMLAELSLDPKGRYLVAYSATGEDPGSGTTQGSFDFQVHFGQSCDGEPKDPGGGGDGHGGHGNDDDPGGHGGHGGNDPGGHSGHRGGGGMHGDHDMSGGRHGGHSGGSGESGHGSTHGGTGGGRHSNHAAGGGGGHDGHGNRNRQGGDDPPGSPTTDKTGDLGREPLDVLPPPGIDMALLALGLAIAVGLFGGVALRGLARS